jgi:uncharacterized BrkB/YihY/UPF0761 family membrane protein
VEPETHDQEESRSAYGRAKLRAEALQERGRHLAERAQEERSRHASVDAAFEMADRDGELGGGIIAGALAYRLFIWLLPLALVAVAGLGIAADAASETPGQAARQVGMAGLVSSSVSGAANGTARWYALLVGIPILVYVTRGLLRALIGAHRILWGDVRARAPKPTIVATLWLLGLLICMFLATGFASALRAHSVGLVGVVATLLAVLPYAGLWLVASHRLPHQGAGWLELLPGALLVGVGVEVLNAVAAYVFGPYAVAKQGTYGALGAAAVLLFGLYLLSRLIVFGAVVNATLFERKERAR